MSVKLKIAAAVLITAAMIVPFMLWSAGVHRDLVMSEFDKLYAKLAADEAAKIIFEPQYNKRDEIDT